MQALRQQQQLARALLAHGISAEIRIQPDAAATVVLDDPRQLVTATALMAKYFPGAARVVCQIL